MKKLEIEFHFTGDSLSIVNEAFVIEQCREMFKEGYLDGQVKSPWEWKTNAQTGHFFAAIAGAAHAFLKESGYKFSDKLASIYYLMENMPSENGFGLSDKWCDIGYGPTGNVIKRSAIPISSMGRSDLHELAKDMTQLLNENGVEVPDVEEYKANKKFKQ